jgi:hypothetical protein
VSALDTMWLAPKGLKQVGAWVGGIGWVCVLWHPGAAHQGRGGVLLALLRLCGLQSCATDPLMLSMPPPPPPQVHNMLRNVARSLVAGGDTGVFSPMHMLVFQKPAEE